MLRLAPEGYRRFVQADTLEASYGGGEANVAVALANCGFDAAFVTKLPAHEIGQAAVNALRRYGVDTSRILRGGERVGIYFLEKGASQRPSKVIYDRSGSSIAGIRPGEFPWKEIFEGARWFHFTGITPALGENVAQVCMEACQAAKEAGLTVSCDLNYRKKLWSREEAGRVMRELCRYVDVCIGNEEDAETVFGLHASGSEVDQGQISREGYQEVAQKLAQQYGFSKVALTLRESLTASDNLWSGMLYTEGQFYYSRKYKIHIVDRVGGGDSFAGGLIGAVLAGCDPQRQIDLASASSCLKHTIEGDFNLISQQEAEALADGSGTGRVQR